MNTCGCRGSSCRCGLKNTCKGIAFINWLAYGGIHSACHGAMLRMEFPELSGFGQTGQHSSWVSNAMNLSQGSRQYITENGGKECTPDYSAIAGLRSIDCITLAALCLFFFLKWTEACLWLWDALLLFRKVMGKLFVVDKWAATGETPWPSGVSAGPGGRLSAFSSWLCYTLFTLRPPGQR